MKKNTIVVITVIVVLAVVVAVFAFLNRDNIAEKKEAQEAGIFFIHANGSEYEVSMDDISALSPFDIPANYKPSTQPTATTRTYQGVSLKSVLESFDIDCSGVSSVSFTAADGYASALSVDEALDDNNCYIVISLDNEPLGTKESGGSGPFMMIMANDKFSQRWCKFLLEVTLQ